MRLIVVGGVSNYSSGGEKERYWNGFPSHKYFPGQSLSFSASGANILEEDCLSPGSSILLVELQVLVTNDYSATDMSSNNHVSK